MTMTRILYFRRGISFIESVIASVVGVFLFSTIIWFVFSTRVETDKSADYFRALQLAQEAMEWAQATPIEILDEQNQQKLSLFQGSLIDQQTGKSTKIFPSADVSYPDQYGPAFFYRQIKVEKVNDSIPNAKFLRQIRVDVFWNEGKAPAKAPATSLEPDRMKKLSLATIVMDENEHY